MSNIEESNNPTPIEQVEQDVRYQESLYNVIEDMRDAALQWGDSAILNPQLIDAKVQEIEEVLLNEGIPKQDIKDVKNFINWRLLTIMEEQVLGSDVLDDMEPTDEDLKANAEDFIIKTIDQRPARIFTATPIEAEQVTVDNHEEAEEEARELFKTIPKRVRRHFKQWLKENKEIGLQYDSNILGALALSSISGKQDKLDIIGYAEIYFAFVAHKVAKLDPVDDLRPMTISEKFAEICEKVELTTIEKQALEYMFISSAVTEGKHKYKVKPEEIFLVTGETKYDVYECPLCIRTLEKKLVSIGVSISIKTQHGERFRFHRAQGRRVKWISMEI